MAQNVGQINTYLGQPYQNTDMVPGKRTIADLIDMIDPWDTPFLKFLGIGPKGRGGGNKASKFRIQNWPNTRVEWINDKLAPLQITLAESGALPVGVAEVTYNLTGLAANVLRKGDVLSYQGENVVVTVATGTTATISRVFGGAAGNAIPEDAVLEIVGRARIEGAESDPDMSTDPYEEFNYTQIFQAEVKVARTANKVPNYGMSSEYNRELEKKFKEQMRLLERTLFYGFRNAGKGDFPRAMGGLPQFTTKNVTALAGAVLQASDIEDAVAKAWHAGGNPSMIVTNSWGKRKISSFFKDPVRTARKEKIGGVVIEYMQTEFGTIGTLMTRWCPQGTMYIIEPEYLGILPFDEFFDEPLAKTGDYERGQMVGEYTFIQKNDEAHAVIQNFSTTA